MRGRQFGYAFESCIGMGDVKVLKVRIDCRGIDFAFDARGLQQRFDLTGK